MHKIIISDTSCFIILSKINELDLLKTMYGEITTTTEIANEYGDDLPSWVNVVEVKDKLKQQLLELQIDKGESSAIALAMEINHATLILDDYKARLIAKKLNLRYTGTLGVIVKAKIEGKIKSVKPLLDKIKTTNFRLSDELENKILKEAKEK